MQTLTLIVLLSIYVTIVAGNHFTCDNGERIWRYKKCDCIAHCSDESDEKLSICPDYEQHCYRCPDSDMYLKPRQVCNGKWDCAMGEDENPGICAKWRRAG